MSSTLGERLAQLIREKGIEQQEAAEKIGIKRSTFGGYVKNTREPNIEKLKIIAKFFDVSVDYLIGNSDEPRNLLYHLNGDLADFVKDPANTTYLDLAKEIKEKTQNKKAL